MPVARDLFNRLVAGIVLKVPSFFAQSRNRESLYGPGMFCNKRRCCK